MELNPQVPIRLTQTDIDAQFIEKGILPHFQNTCKAHTVKSPEDEKYMPTQTLRKHGNWEYVEFRDSAGKPQCKYKVRATPIEGEEEIGKNVHIVWYRDLDGELYVSDNIDPELLLAALEELGV